MTWPRSGVLRPGRAPSVAVGRERRAEGSVQARGHRRRLAAARDAAHIRVGAVRRRRRHRAARRRGRPYQLQRHEDHLPAPDRRRGQRDGDGDGPALPPRRRQVSARQGLTGSLVWLPHGCDSALTSAGTGRSAYSQTRSWRRRTLPGIPAGSRRILGGSRGVPVIGYPSAPVPATTGTTTQLAITPWSFPWLPSPTSPLTGRASATTCRTRTAARRAAGTRTFSVSAPRSTARPAASPLAPPP